jgi:hypothetical protein
MLAIVGDIHGNFYKFRELVEKIVSGPEGSKVTAIIQVGDFGYYPNLIRQLETLSWPIPVYWVDGNHEQFSMFMHLEEVTELHKNIFYVPRGTILNLDGRKIAFLGGAGSVDKEIRQSYGMDWSPMENIAPHEVLRFGDESQVDMMITHCPPQSVIQRHFDPIHLVRYFNLPITWRDHNADIVEKVWEKFGKPQLYCGHMHRSVDDARGVRILNIEEVVYV